MPFMHLPRQQSARRTATLLSLAGRERYWYDGLMRLSRHLEPAARAFSRAAALIVAVAVSLCFSSVAFAQEDDGRSVCLEAHQDAQELRLKLNFIEAKQQAIRCSSENCPSLVQADCARWLVAIEQQTPSVVFKVRVDGVEQFDVQVLHGDKLFLDQLSTTAVPLNPGRYDFTFKVPGRTETKSRTVGFVEGEKYKVVAVDFGDPTPAAAPAATSLPPAAPPEPKRRIPTISYVLGGVGVAAAGAFGVLAVTTRSKEEDLRESCMPQCDASEADSVKRRYLIGDIALAAGVAALTGAVIFYFATPPQAEAPSVALRGGLRHGGGTAELVLRAF
jgi:hypothetical protein